MTVIAMQPQQESERIGEALLFLAMLGGFRFTDAMEYAGVDLAHFLCICPNAVPQFWDTRTESEKLTIVQYTRPPVGSGYRLASRWECLDAAAADAISTALLSRCAKAMRVILRNELPDHLAQHEVGQ